MMYLLSATCPMPFFLFAFNYSLSLPLLSYHIIHSSPHLSNFTSSFLFILLLLLLMLPVVFFFLSFSFLPPENLVMTGSTGTATCSRWMLSLPLHLRRQVEEAGVETDKLTLWLILVT